MIEQATIETTDGCFATINGKIHPPGRYVSIISYIPFQPWHPYNLVSKKMIGGKDYTKISRTWFPAYRDCYFEYVAGSGFGHYMHEDNFFGKITAIPHNRIKRIIEPIPVSGPAIEACSVLGVDPNYAVLLASSTLDCNENGDVDIGIIGRNAAKKAFRQLHKLVENPKRQVYHDYFRRAHPRQFYCSRRKIDIFSLYGDEAGPIESAFEVGEEVVVNDIVADNTDAAFCPAIYRLQNGLFVTYQIEHRMVLMPGDRIQAHAKRAPTGDIFLVRAGDRYEDITGGKYVFEDPGF